MKKFLKWTGISIASILALFILIFSVLILLLNYSNSFVFWGFNKIKNAIPTQEFTYSKFDGNFSKGIEIENLIFKNEGIELDGQKIFIAPKLSCLYKLTLCLEDVGFSNLDIKIADNNNPKLVAEDTNLKGNDPSLLVRIVLTQFSIAVKNLQLSNLSLISSSQKLYIDKSEASDFKININGVNLNKFLTQGLNLEFLELKKDDPISYTKPIDNLEDTILRFQQSIKNQDQTAKSKAISGYIKQEAEKITAIMKKPLNSYFKPTLQGLNQRFAIDINQIKLLDLIIDFANQESLIINEISAVAKTFQDDIIVKANIDSNWLKLGLNFDSNQPEVLKLQAQTVQSIPYKELRGIEFSAVAKGDLETGLALSFVANKDKDKQTTQDNLEYLVSANNGTESDDFWDLRADSLLSGRVFVSFNKAYWPMRSIVVVDNFNFSNIKINNIKLTNQGSFNRNITDLFANIDVNKVNLGVSGHLVGESTHLTLTPLLVSVAGRRVLSHTSNINIDNDIQIKTTNNIYNLNFKPIFELIGNNRLSKDFTGNLKGSFDLSLNLDNEFLHGHYNQSNWKASIPNAYINGTLNKTPFSLVANSEGSSDKLNIDKLNIELGKNIIHQKLLIDLKSDFTKTLIKLDSNINITDLSSILPSWKVNVVANFNVDGTIFAPNIDGSIDLKEIQSPVINIDGAKGTIHVEADNNYLTIIDLNTDTIQVAGQKINNSQIVINGNAHDQRGSININGKDINLDLVYRGRLNNNNGIYSAELNHNKIVLPFVGEIKANNVSSIEFDPNSNDLYVFGNSYKAKDFNIYFNKGHYNFVSKTLDWSGKITDFNLRFIKSFLPKDTMVEGNIDGDFYIGLNDLVPTIKANLHSSIVKLDQIVNYESLKLNLNNIQAGFDYDSTGIGVNILGKINNKSNVSGSIKLTNLSKKLQMFSSIELENLELEDFKSIWSKSEIIKGKVNANITTYGDIDSPEITGSLSLNKPTFDLQVVPFTIKDGSIKIKFEGRDAIISGKLLTDSNPIILDGSLDFADFAQVSTIMKLKSNGLEIRYPLYGNFNLNTDLTILSDLNQVSINGGVHVTQGHIKIVSLKESPIEEVDTVIVNKSSNSENQSLSDFEVNTDIKLTIEPQVNLDAYNLKGNIGGTLNIRNAKLGLGLYGTIKLLNGTYKNYGQDLIVDKGNITFGGAASNPSLQIIAVRNPENTNDDVEVGIEITGLAQSPSVNLFSKPNMSSDQALQYLITGSGGLGEEGNATNLGLALLISSFANMATGLEGLGNKFGIKNLHLVTSKAAQQARLNLVGNITDRLQATAGVGIFTGLTNFSLRFGIASRLYLEANQDTSRSLYLVYRLLWD